MPSVPRVLHQGLAADKPTADATLNQGWLYYETDTDVLQQSWNGTWVAINSGTFANVVHKIDEVTVGGGGAASIAFAAIPQTYTRLRIEVTGGANTAAAGSGFSFNGLRMGINADATASHYRSLTTWLAYENGVGASTQPGTTTEAPLTVGVLADPRASKPTLPGRTVVEISDYANTTFGKIGQLWHATSLAGFDLIQDSGCFFWDQTAGVTDLLFTPDVGNFVAGSTARLYGFV